MSDFYNITFIPIEHNKIFEWQGTLFRISWIFFLFWTMIKILLPLAKMIKTWLIFGLAERLDIKFCFSASFSCLNIHFLSQAIKRFVKTPSVKTLYTSVNYKFRAKPAMNTEWTPGSMLAVAGMQNWEFRVNFSGRGSCKSNDSLKLLLFFEPGHYFSGGHGPE